MKIKKQIQKWFNKKHKFTKQILKFRYCAFTPEEIEESDIVEREMESGKIGIFKIENVKWYSDPGDQWFFDEIFLGYREDNSNLPIATREPVGFIF